MEFKITGTVRDTAGIGVPNLKVRAYDKDLFYDDLLGTAITARDGSFELTYSDRDFKELFEGQPEVYLTVFSADGKLLARTEPTPWGQSTEKQIDIRIDIGTTILPEPVTARIALGPRSAFEFDANVGQNIPQAIAIEAWYVGSGNPASAQRIRFRVLSGPLVFSKDRSTTHETTTDAEGLANLDVQFTAQGFSVVICEWVEDPRVAIFFRGHSEGVTHRLSIYNKPCIPASNQEIKALIAAVDRNGKPVLGATISFEGHLNRSVLEGTVKELGNGTYEGILKTQKAGCWNLRAEDQVTRVRVDACQEMLPGTPKEIKLVQAPDPRAAPPYNEVTLRAYLEDELGNPCDPTGLVAKASGGNLSDRILVGKEARFVLTFAGYQNLQVTIQDPGSGLERTFPVLFAAAWAGGGIGVIWAGSRYKTPIYWLPDPERLVTEAIIDIRADSTLAGFVGFKGVSEGMVFTELANSEPGWVSIQLRSELPVVPVEFPEGVFIGEVTWDCLGAGNTCFSLTATMSPETEPWNKCVSQKVEDRRCICIRVIYRPGDHAGRGAGFRAATQVEKILSSEANVKECCPVMQARVDNHEMTAAEWATLNGAADPTDPSKNTGLGGDGSLSSVEDKLRVNASPVGKKDGCINLYMLPIDMPATLGLTTRGGPNSVIDPTGFAADPYLGAHELGHALGLSDIPAPGDRDNLMFESAPSGQELTSGQCETIFRNIGKYACT